MAPNRGGRKAPSGKKGSSGGTIRNVVLLLFLLQLGVALWLVSKQFGHRQPPPPPPPLSPKMAAEKAAREKIQLAALDDMARVLERHGNGFKGEVVGADPDAMSLPVVRAALAYQEAVSGGGGMPSSGHLRHHDPRPAPARDVHARQSFMKEGAGHPSTKVVIPQLRAESGGGAEGEALAVSGGAMVPSTRNVSVGEFSGAGQCKVLKPEIIIYNRIPKCASGSMNIFIEEAKMKREGTKHHFVICRSSLYTNRHLNGNSQKQYVNDPFRMSHCRNKPEKAGDLAILSRHIFYLNFEPFGKPNPAYVNIIRQPIDRCVSRFYYERDARGTVSGNMDMDTCMARGGPCKFEAWQTKKSVATGSGSRIEQMREECSSNYLSRWFCGMDPFCKMNDQAVLDAAKVNMRDKYAFVGLTAEMKVSFAVLQKIIPDFFGSEGMPMDICNKCKDKGGNSTGSTTSGGHAVKVGRCAGVGCQTTASITHRPRTLLLQSALLPLTDPPSAPPT
mmetsp:Transcript_64376/g.178258  ORF Transcript_64376/g.178258 Transcript_64376/m.178258 type:complete len:504 (+) Transcript_64376:90-1601(+)